MAGDVSQVAHKLQGVTTIVFTNQAFAALLQTGEVVAWGQEEHGGLPSAAVKALLASGVHTLCSNDAAFSRDQDGRHGGRLGSPDRGPEPGRGPAYRRPGGSSDLRKRVVLA